ncbi:hypothetical protein DFH09DRAFT_1286931 [Mycena vulgaris]|nr:hypothetical protein DFH09DRAFT_1286931 [Mycena vulgaris]
MKAFNNIVSAAVVLSTLYSANAAAVSSSASTPSVSDVFSASASSSPDGTISTTTDDSTFTTTDDSTFTSTTTDAGFPTPTGGYVVTGIYTTCLTLTFPAPTPTTDCASDTATIPTTIFGSIPASATPSAQFSSGVNPGGPIQSDSSLITTSDASFPSGINPGGPIIPVADDAVFTTCLVFLPSASATATDTPVTTTTDVFPSASTSAVASGSDALPSASASAVASSSDVLPSASNSAVDSASAAPSSSVAPSDGF